MPKEFIELSEKKKIASWESLQNQKSKVLKEKYKLNRKRVSKVEKGTVWKEISKLETVYEVNKS